MKEEDGVVAGGDERGHVEEGADLGAAAGGVALAAELAAVVVERYDAGVGPVQGPSPRGP